MAYLSRNLKYPKAAKEAGMEAKLYIQFSVNTDGSISDAEVLRINIEITKKTKDDEDALEESLINEAKRVVNKMPNWEPAVGDDGVAVKSKYQLPIVFKLKN